MNIYALKTFNVEFKMSLYTRCAAARGLREMADKKQLLAKRTKDIGERLILQACIFELLEAASSLTNTEVK